MYSMRQNLCHPVQKLIIYLDWVFGDSLYDLWIQQWVLQLATKYDAIIACGNYRLPPESTGVEILSDIDDFWKWLHTSVVSNYCHPYQRLSNWTWIAS